MGQTTFSGPVVSQNGFIENSFTTAERDAIVDPTAGLLIYNTTTNAYEVYNGTGWQDAFAPPAPATTTYAISTDYSWGYFSGMGTNGSAIFNNPIVTPMVNAILALTVGDTFTVLSAYTGTSFTFTVTSPINTTGTGYDISVSSNLPLGYDPFDTVTLPNP